MIRKDFPKLGEHYFEERLPNGLLVRVMEKPGFANLYLLMASKMIITGTLYTAILWLSGSVTFKESLHYIIKK